MGNLAGGMALCDLWGHRQEDRPAKSARKLAKKLALYRLRKVREKLVGQLLGRAVDQPLPELGQLAADLGLDIIGQKRTAILFRQRHGSAPLGKTGHAALAFARDLVAVRRIEIAERHLA